MSAFVIFINLALELIEVFPFIPLATQEFPTEPDIANKTFRGLISDFQSSL